GTWGACGLRAARAGAGGERGDRVGPAGGGGAVRDGADGDRLRRCLAVRSRPLRPGPVRLRYPRLVHARGVAGRRAVLQAVPAVSAPACRGTRGPRTAHFSSLPPFFAGGSNLTSPAKRSVSTAWAGWVKACVTNEPGFGEF